MLGTSATTAAREAAACAVVALVCIGLASTNIAGLTGLVGVGQGWAWLGAGLLSITAVVHYCSWLYLSRGGPQ